MSDPFRSASSRRRRSRGQSLVEFALILPLLLLLFALMVDFARLFYAYLAVENAAKEGALYGSRNPICATATSSTNCVDPENAEYRIVREATNVAFDIATPYCVDPSGTTRAATSSSPTANCQDGDVYVAAVSHQFRLVTPILSQFFGSGLTLASESRSVVVNSAFDPRAGASGALAVSWVDNVPESCSDIGSAPCYARSPRVDVDETVERLTVLSPTTLNISLRVQNTSGIDLTGVSVSIREGASVITPGTCTYPATMPVGYDSGNCVFQAVVSWPTSGNPTAPYVVPFTVTVDADQQEASTDGIQVVVLEPARIAVSLQVSPYRSGRFESASSDGYDWGPTPLGGPSNLTVATRTAATPASVDPSVWYFLRIQNTSATAGGISGFDVVEALPAGGTSSIVGACTGPFGAEFAFPRNLAGGESIDCFFERERATPGATIVEATVVPAVGSILVASQRISTVTVEPCNGDAERQVPMLVDLAADALNGTTSRYTVGDAREQWQAHGLGGFSPTDNDAAEVLSQDVQAYSCGDAATDVVVTYVP